MKHLKIAVNNIKLAIYYCHLGTCQTTQKLVHFYMPITLKQKVVEKFVKTLFYGENTNLLNGVHIGIASHVTEIKETYFEIYTKQVSCPLAFLF